VPDWLTIWNPEKVNDGMSDWARLPRVVRTAMPEFLRATSPGIRPNSRIVMMRTSSTDTTAAESSSQSRVNRRFISSPPVMSRRHRRAESDGNRGPTSGRTYASVLIGGGG
jgi:hypothetical protein